MKHAALVIATCLLTGILASAKERLSTDRVVRGEYVVQLRAPVDAFGQRSLERLLGGPIVSQVRPDMVVVRRNENERAEPALRALNALPAVVLAEPNAIYRAVKLPNDPDFKKLWGMKNTGEVDTEGTRGIVGVDINVEKAWDISTGSKEVVIAVIDTGVDFAIPDLAANAWTNQAEANGVKGVDDDNNGYIDDIHGFNLINNTGDPTDDNGHGSHCAGTIGASGDNGVGVAGVNWNVSIVAAKFLDSSGSGTLGDAIKALDYTRKIGARVLSNSWAGDVNSELLKKAIQDTRDAGQLFVVAAGNDGMNTDVRPTYPMGFQTENMISVAAVDNRGELAYFSNYGTNTVDVAAPGVNIVSTTPKGLEAMSGTSMATPHVAGVAALLLSVSPNMKYLDLKQRLISSSRPIWSLAGQLKSGGITDALYALNGEKPPADTNDPRTWTGTRSETVSSKHPYDMSTSQAFTIKVEGAKRISLHFAKFETEAGYDKLQFFNSKNELLGTWSGDKSNRFAPIIDGDTVNLKFESDSSVNGYGFDIDAVSYEM